MKDFFFRRIANSLVPADEDTHEYVRRLKPNQLMRVRFPNQRSVEQMRYYRALCRLVASNHRTLTTPGMVSEMIKIETGHVTLITSARTGETYRVPDSLAFDAMGHDEWVDWLPLAKDYVAQELLPDVRDGQIHEEILSMLEDHRR